ncbi:hypothetical protein [Priestia aryabhattai]
MFKNHTMKQVIFSLDLKRKLQENDITFATSSKGFQICENHNEYD